MKISILLLLATLLPLASSAAAPKWPASTSKGKVKVFILAGQSNMEGRGFPEPLSWQVTQEKYRKRWTHFIKDGDYEAFTKKIAETPIPMTNVNHRLTYGATAVTSGSTIWANTATSPSVTLHHAKASARSSTSVTSSATTSTSRS